jgi:hypothetical protein
LVVSGVGVVGVEAQGVAFAWGDEWGAGGAEGGVGAGVAEVPGELYAGDFDLQGCERGSRVARGGPQTLGFDGEGGKEESEEDEGKVFDAPEVGGFGASAGEKADKEEEVREDEKAEGNPEVEEEMVVERGAVGAGVGWKEPRWNEQKRGVVGEARLAGVGHGLRIARPFWFCFRVGIAKTQRVGHRMDAY